MIRAGFGLRALVGVVSVTALGPLVAACTHTVDGSAWKALPPLVVPAEAASAIVDADLARTTDDPRPPPPIEVDRPECAVAAGPSTQAVYTEGWNQFELVTMQEAVDYWDHSVTQTVGRYRDQTAAKKVFDGLSTGLNMCLQKPVVSTDTVDDSQSQWTFAVEHADADTVRWTATQTDGDNWECNREARLTDAWVLQVAVCQVGNGRPNAVSIIEKLAANFRA